MAKERVKRTANRLSRTDKISKRLRGVEAKSAYKRKSTNLTFTVFHKQPVELQGFIVEVNAESVLFRHKRTNASKRMLVSRFDRSEVVELYGDAGEVSSITVMREVPVREVIGTIVSDEGGIVTLKSPSGETVKLYMNSNVRIEANAEDDSEPSGKSGKKAKAEKPAKKVKVKKSKKSKKSDDDDLDDLD